MDEYFTLEDELAMRADEGWEITIKGNHKSGLRFVCYNQDGNKRLEFDNSKTLKDVLSLLSRLAKEAA